MHLYYMLGPWEKLILKTLPCDYFFVFLSPSNIQAAVRPSAGPETVAILPSAVLVPIFITSDFPIWKFSQVHLSY